jgi:hypothetical protein
MKKKSFFTALVALSAILFSCTKEAVNLNSSPGITTPAILPQVRIVSDWVSLSFSGLIFNNAPALQGKFSISSPVRYEYNDHVQLAYARRKGRESYIFYKLPATINTTEGNIQLQFTLDYTSFTINIWNSSSSFQQPDAQQFERMEFRYIVISRSTYQAININWDIYSEVAAALNL